MFFKNLLLLESVTGDGKYRQAMADYARSRHGSRALRLVRRHRGDPTGGLRTALRRARVAARAVADALLSRYRDSS